LTETERSAHAHVVMIANARVVELRTHPRRVEEIRVDHEDRGLVGVERANLTCSRVGDVPRNAYIFV
jgi:hypothetical protein